MVAGLNAFHTIVSQIFVAMNSEILKTKSYTVQAHITAEKSTKNIDLLQSKLVNMT